MNKKETKSFILYCNFENQFKLLSLEERGILISAIFEYARERKFECELPPLVNMAFSLIKDTMDRDYEEYLERCEINAINGRKGGRPRKVEESDEPTFTPRTERYFEKPKKTYNDNCNGNNNENNNKNDSDSGSGNKNGSAVKDRYTPRRCRDIKTGEEVSVAEFCKNLIANLPKTPPERSACSADSVEKAKEEKTDSEELYEMTQEELNPYALSESDREMLLSKGIPKGYIDERCERARDYGVPQKKSAYTILLEWWEKDREIFRCYHQQKKPDVKNRDSDKSYNTEEFFEAACRRAREEFGIKDQSTAGEL